MAKPVTQIRVAGYRVGIIGLLEVFEEVRRSEPPNAARCQDELLRRVKLENFLPEDAELDYRRALWRAYRRWKGEPVEPEETTGIRIEVLGPGCYACDKLMEDLRDVLAQSDIQAELEHVRDPLRIAEYGLLATPALVVNGKVVCSGKRPRKGQLEALIAGGGN